MSLALPSFLSDTLRPSVVLSPAWTHSFQLKLAEPSGCSSCHLLLLYKEPGFVFLIPMSTSQDLATSTKNNPIMLSKEDHVAGRRRQKGGWLLLLLGEVSCCELRFEGVWSADGKNSHCSALEAAACFLVCFKSNVCLFVTNM